MEYFKIRTKIIFIFKKLLQRIFKKKLVYDLKLVRDIYYGYRYEIE